MLKMIKIFALLLLLSFNCPSEKPLNKLFLDYERERKLLGITDYVMDYKDNLRGIPSSDKLSRFKQFYEKYNSHVKRFQRSKLTLEDKINFDHLCYIIQVQEKRVNLEIAYKQGDKLIPVTGLHNVDNSAEWYKFYVQLQTSTSITPEHLFAFGMEQVKMVRNQIETIQEKMGYKKGDPAFYRFLQQDTFYVSDTALIEALYRAKAATIRRNLYRFFSDTLIPPLDVSTWSMATPSMPPAIYQLSRNRFEYNFSSGKHNLRSMDWVLNHEGLPGHHFQFSIQAKGQNARPSFIQQTFYPGNVEGWACYTEYLGKELGQYQTLAEELGKWEWDLVRSVRVVLDVGIHYLGWDYEKAMEYWREQIQGQDEIANREITRVTNWPAQALSYKVGAMKIMEWKNELKVDSFNIRKFHSVLLSFSSEPLEVIGMNIAEAFHAAR